MYGINPANSKEVPLYINKFFLYMFSKAVTWQSMQLLALCTLADVEQLVKATHVIIKSYDIELPSTQYVSKTLVAHLEAMLGASP